MHAKEQKRRKNCNCFFHCKIVDKGRGVRFSRNLQNLIWYAFREATSCYTIFAFRVLVG